MKTRFRILSLILMITLLSGLFSLAIPFSAEEESTRIIACSDFQAPTGNDEGTTTVEGILDAMKAHGITSADGFFACGDYDYEYTETKEGIAALKTAVSGMVSENMVFTQGNHDSPIGTNGLASSGDNDPDSGAYGVFVINEDDYMWYNSNEETIKNTAQDLIEYLNRKLTEGFDKPIFVLSHLPLHYNMRTRLDGDAKYANYLFDALNEAAGKGLNIFYLFGHDHSNGWDDYLGGSAVYLAKGDSILIAQRNQNRFAEKTLNFTYFNAGFTGYYDNHNGADDSLSMTVIDITSTDVTVTRYTDDGVHNMKSAGVLNAYKGESGYSANTTVYEGAQTIPLTKVTDTTPIPNLLNREQGGRVYKRITSADQLKDGGRYLMVCNKSGQYYMLPEVVTKTDTEGVSRIGFEIEEAISVGANTLYVNGKEKEWIFTKKDAGWLIGNDTGNIKFTRTAQTAVTATLEETGDVLTVQGDVNAFTFHVSSYSLNYNARGLINAYTSDPATFALFEFVGCTVTVSASAAPDYVMPGEAVSYTAPTAPEGMEFNTWVAEGITLADPTNPVASFTMPDEAVTLTAQYKPTVTNGTAGGDDTDKPDTPISPIVFVIVGIVAGLAVGVCITLIIVKKKK